MNKTIEYPIQYDVVAEISYIGKEEGEYYFKIHRHWAELTFDDEDDEAKAVVFPDGEIGLDGYDYLRAEEEVAIKEMMKEILKK